MNVAPGHPLPVATGQDLAGMRVTVMGLGHFSGGVETVRFLASHGADVTVTDLKTRRDLADSVAKIHGHPVRLRLGGHVREDFTATDLVVASPAVPPESEWLALAAGRGIPIVTELTLTMRLLRCRTAWVTGTCGKSTTTALLARMLAEGGARVHSGGNIGRALVAGAERYRPDDVAVLEVSSFQLEWMARDRIVPDLAIVTNVTPNHLDRHHTFERYVDAKAAAIAGPGISILSDDDPESVRRLAPLAGGPVHRTSLEHSVERGAFLDGDRIVSRLEGREEELLRTGDVRLAGRFNVMNAMQAALAARLLGVPPEGIPRGAAGFSGLPHRLEDLGTVRGIRGINDSKATTPEAAIRALGALDEPVVLLAGGFERGADLEAFAAEIRQRVRSLVLFGESAGRLGKAVGEGGPPVVRAGTIEEAVDLGAGLARVGDVLLLSPGHASWDQFTSYEERGDRFRRRFAALAPA